MNQGDSNKTFAPGTLGNMTLGLCIETLRKYFEAEPYSGFNEELETIKHVYRHAIACKAYCCRRSAYGKNKE